MYVRILLIAAGLGVVSLLPAAARDHRPKSTNANVRRATRKAPRFKPMVYKAPKKNKKPAKATYGAR